MARIISVEVPIGKILRLAQLRTDGRTWLMAYQQHNRKWPHLLRQIGAAPNLPVKHKTNP
jgi:hypothetical protein